MRLLDTHLHIIDMNRLHYPWLDSTPALKRDAFYATYAAEAKRVGITDVLHMEVDVGEADIENETIMVKHLMTEKGSLMRGAISACRPESQDFPAFLERQLAKPEVKGFRRVLHVMPDDTSESLLFRENIRRLGAAKRPFDICVLPHQLSKAMALADAAPNVQFVLDHCGVPAVKDGMSDAWKEGITQLARRPHVAVKISGVIAYADREHWSLGDIKPFVEHAINTFGWDRVVWGSDWPVCTLAGALSTWVAAMQALVHGASEDETQRLFHKNACRIWNIP